MNTSFGQPRRISVRKEWTTPSRVRSNPVGGGPVPAIRKKRKSGGCKFLNVQIILSASKVTAHNFPARAGRDFSHQTGKNDNLLSRPSQRLTVGRQS